MPQELQAGAVSLLQLFKGEKLYEAPLFQRQYVWTKKKNLDPFWDSITALTEGVESARFLGALVLEVKSAGLAFEPDKVWIIDGQQRLTTLFMSLLAIALEAEKAGVTELATTICRQYLFNQDGSYKNTPKVKPTLLDHQQFKDLFKDLDSMTARTWHGYGEETGALATGFKQIQREVRERCFLDDQFDEGSATNLVRVLLEKLKFVQIVLADNLDPHQVFDSLNFLGSRLETKDLIRNVVFQKVSDDPHEAVKVYENQWIPLEQELGDRFEAYFFPFTLVSSPKTTKSEMITELKDRWKSLSAHEVIKGLRRYVPTYQALTADDDKFRDGISMNSDVAKRFFRLNRMPAPSSMYPFIFHLMDARFRDEVDDETAIKNLDLVESFLVRRAFAGFEPTGLHAVFKDLWQTTGGDPELFKKVIDSNPTVQFPSDEEFQQYVEHRPLYGRRLAKYVLIEYERSLIGGDPYFEPSDVTIDHIMPQTLTVAWSKVIDAETHQVLRNTWANLVPLSLPANSEKGQQTWQDVREYLTTETAFKTTKRLANENEKWTSDEIRSRGKALAEWAVNRWRK